MLNSPLVSVVTPVYNGEAFIAQCLQSVLDQTYANWELVVVDNCSSDKTPQIIAEFAAKDERVKIFTNPHTVGALENHNIAVGHVALGERLLQNTAR